MRKFRKGDKVEYIGDTLYGLVYGMRGTILGYPKKELANPGVSFIRGAMDVVVAVPDTVRNTWDCNGVAPNRDGLYISERNLKKVKEKK